MQTELQITQNGIKLDQEALDRIHRRVEDLERHEPRMTGCHVTCEANEGHSGEGPMYKVRLTMPIPRKTLVVSRQSADDLNAAIRDAFDAARRQLEDARRMRDDPRKRTHEPATSEG